MSVLPRSLNFLHSSPICLRKLIVYMGCFNCQLHLTPLIFSFQVCLYVIISVSQYVSPSSISEIFFIPLPFVYGNSSSTWADLTVNCQLSPFIFSCQVCQYISSQYVSLQRVSECQLWWLCLWVSVMWASQWVSVSLYVSMSVCLWVESVCQCVSICPLSYPSPDSGVDRRADWDSWTNWTDWTEGTDRIAW